MNGEIEKNFKKANILKFVLFGIDAVCVFVTFSGIFYFDNFVLYPYMVLLLGVLFWITIFYLFKLYPICKSVRLLNKYKLQDTSDDLETKSFNLQRSKIFIGSKAFYAKKTNTVIPYYMVSWVYIRQTRIYFIPLPEFVVFQCRDGSRFLVRANRDELQMLLQCIYQFSPDLILGYGNEQKKQYELVKHYFRNIS